METCNLDIQSINNVNSFSPFLLTNSSIWLLASVDSCNPLLVTFAKEWAYSKGISISNPTCFYDNITPILKVDVKLSNFLTNFSFIMIGSKEIYIRYNMRIQVSINIETTHRGITILGEIG